MSSCCHLFSIASGFLLFPETILTEKLNTSIKNLRMLLILGGISSIEDLEDETVVGAANFALSTLDAYDDDDNKRVFSKIIKGRKQVSF